jgi:hypothetical protein
VSGEPEPSSPPPSLRDLFRERMLHPPPELENGEPAAGEAAPEE